MQRKDIEKAAESISSARIAGARLDALPGEYSPVDETEAYEVQAEVHRILSSKGLGRVVGHKIGCTTPVMQEFLGIDNPCAGAIFQPTIHFQEGMLKSSEYLHPGVECELAVFIGSEIIASNEPHTRDSVAPHVQAVFAAIEIVDDRWNDYTKIVTPSLIADDFFGAGCVVGEPAADWQNLDLGALSGEMRINGKKVGEGTGSDILGHPLEALAWLANSLNGRGASLQQGEIVMLGSLVQTQWVNKMDRVEIEIEGLGSAGAWFG